MGVLVTKEEFNLRSKLNELNFSTVPYEKMPPGTVIQHVYNQTRSNGHMTTTSTSFADMSYSVSITPHFSNSLLLIEWQGIAQQPNTHHSVSIITVYRNNTTNLGDTQSFNGMSATGEFASNGAKYVTASNNFFVYDEPGTTQKVSYHIWGKTSSSGTAYISHTGVTNCLSVKEIRQ
tara:strand:- start:260 stop:790 length:531 start_codon:yes stop_codon:yes gene_type:complete